MDRRRFLLTLGALALPAGCATQDAREQALLGRLKAARFRLLGEVHDNAEHHAIRARLLDALGAAGLRPLVALEQFDSEHDASLQALQRTRKVLLAEDVARAVQFDRKGWNWQFYRPIVEVALRRGMPLRAANLSRAAAMRIARGQDGAAVPAWPAERERALRDYLYEGHCRALPESAMAGMVAAQRARDLTMANALRDAPPDGAVLIAGNGHVRRDFGVPQYLPGNVLSVGFLEEGSADESSAFDYAWVTPAARRDDPCAKLLRKK